MIVCTPISKCARNVVHLSGQVQRQMSNGIYTFVSRSPSSSCCFSLSTRYSEPKYALLSVSKTSSPSVIGFQAFHGSCFGSTLSKHNGDSHLLRVRRLVSCGPCRRPRKTDLNISLGYQSMNVRILVPKKGIIPRIKCNVGPLSWISGGSICGLLLCNSSSEPVHAESGEAKESKEDGCDSSFVGFSHGKKVYTDYSIIGIPGDGRCLFRSVAHGACLRSAKPAPSEPMQRELADELRARVADEFVKRREETEWFIEGDFDRYVLHIRKPHVWGGEPELFMASHVLQMPITVYMHDSDSGGLISIAEYGQEYGKENPINVLYHGFGHYDALQIPGKKGAQSRL